MKRRISPATIIAIVALFFSLAGSGLAASQTPTRAVRPVIAARADRRAEARPLRLPMRDAHAQCTIASRYRTRCRVELCSRWFVGMPPMLYRGTDEVYRRGGGIHVAFGPGGAFTALCHP